MTWPFLKRSPAKKTGLDLAKMDLGLSRELSRVLAAGGVPTFRQALAKLTAELDRARRYSRPLAILVLLDDRSPAPSATLCSAITRRSAGTSRPGPKAGSGAPSTTST